LKQFRHRNIPPALSPFVMMDPYGLVITGVDPAQAIKV